MKTQLIKIANQTLNIYTSGQQTKDHGIIFLHGNSLSALTFKHQLNSPLENFAQLVAIDWPGCGDSPFNENGYSVKTMIDIIRNTVEYFGFKKCILVGHSIGGHLAIEALPDCINVHGLVIIGVPPLHSIEDFGRAFMPGLVPEFYKKELSEQEIERIVPLICVKKENIQLLKNFIEKANGKTRELIFQTIPVFLQDEVAILNNNKRFSTLIYQSKHESNVNLGYLRTLKIDNLWKNSVFYADCDSHTPFLDYPEEFNVVIQEYVSEIFAM